jgi:hypothetical protein
MEASEAVIQFLKAAGLSTSQIASKKHYGDGWEAGSPAIVVRQDGGDPNLYIPVRSIRLEIRCFAASDYAALTLMSEVSDVFVLAERQPQVVTGGTALIYWINEASGISALYDPDAAMHFALAFFEAAISRETI